MKKLENVCFAVLLQKGRNGKSFGRGYDLDPPVMQDRSDWQVRESWVASVRSHLIDLRWLKFHKKFLFSKNFRFPTKVTSIFGNENEFCEFFHIRASESSLKSGWPVMCTFCAYGWPMGFSGVAKWAEGWEIWVPPWVSCVIGYSQGSGPFSWPIQLIYIYFWKNLGWLLSPVILK